MKSRTLSEYLRTGFVPPVKFGYTKDEILTLLGLPDGWAGGPGHNFGGVTISHFVDSPDWCYGRAWIEFGEAGSVIGMSLDYLGLQNEVFEFGRHFMDLPKARFSISEMIELLRNGLIQYEDHRSESAPRHALVTEGRIVASVSRTGRKWSDDDFVISLNSFRKAESLKLLRRLPDDLDEHANRRS